MALESFQVAYSFWPLSVALGSTQPLKEIWEIYLFIIYIGAHSGAIY